MKDKFLFLIPARSGSKGIRHKNIKNFCGKPLMAWTIEEAKKSKYYHTLVLSSDSEDYLKIGIEYGCDFAIKRPRILSTDTASSIDVVEHIIEKFSGFDYVVLLQPTSPFRSVEDIDNAIDYMITNNGSSCVSINEAKESPYWMYRLKKSGELNNIIQKDNSYLQRQTLPKAYSLNGAIYVNKIHDLIERKEIINEQTLGYIMKKSKSYDIDTKEDWLIAEMLFAKNNK